MRARTWGREDSNLRRLSRRVYSPFPLAARAHPREARGIVASQLVKRYDVIVDRWRAGRSTTAYRLAEQGASVLLADKATFPRDKPCGGGMTLRAVRQCPVDPTPGRRGADRRGRAALSLPRGGRPPDARADRLDDPAPASGRLSARRGARAGCRGPRGRARVAIEPGNTVVVSGERVTADALVGADGANGVTAKALGLGGRNRLRCRLRRERQVPDPAAGALRPPARPRARRHPRAATPGSSPRAITRTSASAAGRARARSCASTCKRACEAHGLDPDSLESLRGHRLPLRRPGTRIAARAQPARRGRRRADRPGLGRRHVRVLRLLPARVRARSSTSSPVALGLARAVRGGGRRELAPLHRASWKLKKALDRWPRAPGRSRARALWVTIRGMLDGELPTRKQRGLARVPLRALAILGGGPVFSDADRV